MLKAGKLDQRITITPVTLTRSPSMAVTETPDADAAFTVWANVRQQGANERERVGITGSENTYAIRIRYRDGVDSTCTVTWRGKSFAISGVVVGGRNNREWIDIAATESK